ncbi:MAG: PAS domain-containing protein, partial [Candidatus Omnitrophica bacterium]|nr:PAS domain-containing protein [Candidatus Omnitrophota bacterium]
MKFSDKKVEGKSNPALKNSSVLKKIRKEFLTEEKILKGDFDDAQLYFDFVDTMLIVLGKDQRVLKINKKGCQILGYPEDKIIGKKYFDNFIPARFRQEMKSFFQDLISGKKILRRNIENPVLTAKGDRLIAWRTVVLNKPDGTIERT